MLLMFFILLNTNEGLDFFFFGNTYITYYVSWMFKEFIDTN